MAVEAKRGGLSLETYEIARAAGFFDGEGCTTLYSKPRRSMDAVRQPTVTITQVNKRHLERFQRAVVGLGRIYGPYRRSQGKPQYIWRATRWVEAQAVIALLWRWLDQEKRSQATRCFAAYRLSISRGRLCRAGLHPKPRRYGRCSECKVANHGRWARGHRQHLKDYAKRYRAEHPKAVARWASSRKEKRHGSRTA